MLRKVLSVVLSAVTVINLCILFPISVDAQVITTDDYLYEVLDDNSARITKYVGGDAESVVIPSELDQHPVTEIGDWAFNVRYLIVNHVSLPETVTTIGSGAFSSMLYLTDIEIPASVTSIGSSAFSYCNKLTDITIPSVSSIEDSTFRSCSSLKHIDIPDTVVTIDDWAFADCTSLSEISFSEQIETIGDYAFRKCPLEEFSVPDLQSVGEYAFAQCEALKTVSLPGTLTTMGDYAFAKCTALTDLMLEEGIRSISARAFNECTALKTISLPSTLLEISDNAFYQCESLEGFATPAALSRIGRSAFYRCTSLTEVTLNTGLKTIDDWSFFGCTGIKSIIIPDTVTYLGIYAFSQCRSLASVNIPPLIDTLEGGLFSECFELVEIDIPANIRSIGQETFHFCQKLNTVTMTDNVTSVGGSAFAGCIALDSINLSKNIPVIRGRTFTNCKSLTELILPESLERIEDEAFTYCQGLTTIDLPDTLKSIGTRAFDNCSNLESIEIPASVESIGSSVFAGCPALSSLSVNEENSVYDSRGNCNAVIETTSDALMFGIKTTIIPDSITSIGDSAFSGCTGLIQVNIPNGVTSIGNSAFSNCSGLEAVIIPQNVNTIGEYAFFGCSSVKSLTIQDAETSIGNRAFNLCIKLENVELGDQVTSVGEYAFYRCPLLKSIHIPKSVTFIDTNAFGYDYDTENYYVKKLDDFTIYGYENTSAQWYATNRFAFFDEEEDYTEYRCGDYTYQRKKDGTALVLSYTGEDVRLVIPGELDEYPVTYIDADVFRGNESIISVHLPDTLTRIEPYAFCDCTELTEVVIGKSVKGIGRSAFENCKALTTVSTPEPFSLPSSSSSGQGSSSSSSSSTPSGSADYYDYYICSNAFKNCTSLNNVSLPNVKGILDSAFYGCTALTDIVLPDSVDTIGYEAFCKCSLLKNVDFPASLVRIYGYAFSECDSLTNIVIPDTVREIGYYAFYKCEALEQVDLPESLSEIQGGAFSDCTLLHNVVFNGNVTRIREYAFSNCSSLQSINIPDTVTEFGYGAFRNCISLTSITLPGKLESIDSEAFLGCSSLTEITIPADVETLRNNAFKGCTSLKKATFLNHDTIIQDNNLGYIDRNNGSKIEGFTICGLNGSTAERYAADNGFIFVSLDDAPTEPPTDPLFEYYVDENGEAAIIGYLGEDSVIRIPATLNGKPVTRIESLRMDDKSKITDIILPDSITEIGNYAFNSFYNLRNVNIPDSIKTISDYAFIDCVNLTSVTLGSGIETVGVGAFYGCTELSEVYCPDKAFGLALTSFSNTAWYNDQPEGVVYLVKNVYCYKGKCPERIMIRPGTLGIADGAFKDCLNLKTATLPDSLESVGTSAFFNCPKMKSVSIPPSVQSIGSSAFGYYYDELTGQYKGINSFRVYGYHHSTAEQYVNDQPNHPFIFSDIEQKPTDRQYDDFTYQIADNESVTITGYTGRLTSVTIPKKMANHPVTIIGEGAFSGNEYLKKLTLSDGVSCIEKNAFQSCGCLTDVYYYGTESDWKSIEIKDGNDLLKRAEIHYCHIVSNASSGISVAGDVSDVSLITEDVTDEAIVSDVVLSDNRKVTSAYDITLRADGEAVQPEDEVVVSIPAESDREKIYRLEQDLTLTDMNAGYENGFLIFTTDRFRTYLVVEAEQILGDVDGDGNIEIRDATWIQRSIADIEIPFAISKTTADVDGDGNITVMDATAIQHYLANMKNTFNIGTMVS